MRHDFNWAKEDLEGGSRGIEDIKIKGCRGTEARIRTWELILSRCPTLPWAFLWNTWRAMQQLRWCTFVMVPGGKALLSVSLGKSRGSWMCYHTGLEMSSGLFTRVGRCEHGSGLESPAHPGVEGQKVGPPCSVMLTGSGRSPQRKGCYFPEKPGTEQKEPHIHISWIGEERIFITHYYP